MIWLLLISDVFHVDCQLSSVLLSHYAVFCQMVTLSPLFSKMMELSLQQRTLLIPAPEHPSESEIELTFCQLLT